jgi:glucosamine 6-phosphate synthetase-like amidotransferase/phosphosugar isomerase protein
MCGQVGIIFGNGERDGKQIEHLTNIFTELLLQSETRGFHATGIGWVNRDGKHLVHKQPVPAHEFVTAPAYEDVLAQVDNRTTILMGHTRWKTRGSQEDNANNHPQVSRYCQGTHNGHIGNADHLFRHFKLPRKAIVDSEIIFRIADSAIAKGRIDTDRLSGRLSLCRGQMSAVITTWRDPETVIIVKGDKPLEFRYSTRHRVLLYASESEFLDQALGDEAGWVEWRLPLMRMAIFRTENLAGPVIRPFRFDEDIRHRIAAHPE